MSESIEVVDDQFRTSITGIWAAGDVARFPYAYTGERVRMEHWGVAEQQGQAAARSMLGKGTRQLLLHAEAAMERGDEVALA